MTKEKAAVKYEVVARWESADATQFLEFRRYGVNAYTVAGKFIVPLSHVENTYETKQRNAAITNGIYRRTIRELESMILARRD